MRKLFKILIILYGLSFGSFACQEIRPLSPPKDPPIQVRPVDGCQPPPIEKNIVGAWHFESTYNSGNRLTRGTVTFDATGKIIDPDSLFENNLDVGPVLSKTYDPILASPFPDFPGQYFAVTLTAKQSVVTAYFSLVSNECDKIHLRLFDSGHNLIGFTLTR